MKKLRIVFFGTPHFAVASLEALVKERYPVVAVVTAPDKPAGRGHRLQASPVKEYALAQGIPVLQPEKLKDESFLQTLAAFKADLQIVVAFRMLPEAVWNMPPLGTYNVHASLLPDYRGAAPINWAIINGERETGVTTFKLRHEIDTGNVLMQQKVAIDPGDNAGSLHDKLMAAGAGLLLASVRKIESGNYILHPQPETGTHKEAPKIHKEDCIIRWEETAERVHNFIRGLSPVPGAFTTFITPTGSTEARKIFETRLTGEPAEDEPGTVSVQDERLLVACADNWLEITSLQPPGKKRMTASEFLRGVRHEAGTINL